MLNAIYKLYAYLFSRRYFIKWNKFLYQISLRGLSILNCQNDYLIGEKFWLKKYLRSKYNPVVLDVGANIGKYSNEIYNINKETTILAFEPHPKTYKKLINNVKLKNSKLLMLELAIVKN